MIQFRKILSYTLAPSLCASPQLLLAQGAADAYVQYLPRTFERRVGVELRYNWF